jgi:hypothetical protein
VREHQKKERAKVSREPAAENGETADEMRESQKFLRDKPPISPLIAKKHSDNRGDRKGIENQ